MYICIFAYMSMYVCTFIRMSMYIRMWFLYMHMCMYVCSGIHCTPFWIWMLCSALYLVVYLLEISTADTSLIKALMSQFSIYATVGGVSNDTFRYVHLLLILLCRSHYSYQLLLFYLLLQLPFFTGAITRATAQCARLINFDNRACGGVVHEVDKLLVPPAGSILHLIEKGDNYTLLRKIIEVSYIDQLCQQIMIKTPCIHTYNALPGSGYLSCMQRFVTIRFISLACVGARVAKSMQ